MHRGSIVVSPPLPFITVGISAASAVGGPYRRTVYISWRIVLVVPTIAKVSPLPIFPVACRVCVAGAGAVGGPVSALDWGRRTVYISWRIVLVVPTIAKVSPLPIFPVACRVCVAGAGAVGGPVSALDWGRRTVWS